MAGGPIGGRRQEGKYKLDARFNKANLIKKKIESIAERSSAITVYNLDASDFIKNIMPTLPENDRSEILVYFDPPYVAKGSGLYQNSYTEEDHRNPSKLIHGCAAKWMVTYDECALTKKLYGDLSLNKLAVGYCAYKIKKGREILVLSDGLSLDADIIVA